MVDGVKSSCVHYKKKTKLGHIFMFDIDDKPPIGDLVPVCMELIHQKDISHLFITETLAGYHLWCLDIKTNKTEWFSLFMNLKSLFKSDYEFSVNWILRTGRKDWIRPPRVVYALFNEDIEDRRISKGHLFILYAYADLLNIATTELLETQDGINTLVKLLKYRSWNFPNER